MKLAEVNADEMAILDMNARGWVNVEVVVLDGSTL